MNDDQTNEILREILKWQRLQGIEILKKKVKKENLFEDEKDVLIYYHSDSNKSMRDLARIVGVKHSKVQRLWNKWIDAGVVEAIEKYRGRRCKRVFELNELGLELPKATQRYKNGKQKDNA